MQKDWINLTGVIMPNNSVLTRQITQNILRDRALIQASNSLGRFRPSWRKVKLILKRKVMDNLNSWQSIKPSSGGYIAGKELDDAYTRLQIHCWKRHAFWAYSTSAGIAAAVWRKMAGYNKNRLDVEMNSSPNSLVWRQPNVLPPNELIRMGVLTRWGVRLV